MGEFIRKDADLGNRFAADFALHRQFTWLRLCVMLTPTVWYIMEEASSSQLLVLAGTIYLLIYLNHLRLVHLKRRISRQPWLMLLDICLVYLLIRLTGGEASPASLLLPLILFLHWPFVTATAKQFGLAVMLFGLLLVGEPSPKSILFRAGSLVAAALASILSGRWLSQADELKRRELEQHERLERQNGYLMLLNEIGRSLSANTGMEQLFETMYKEVSRVMSTDVFFVALYDERGESVEIRYLYEAGVRYPSQMMPLNNGPTSQAIRTGQPVVYSSDAARVPGISVIGLVDPEEQRVESMVVMPMRLEERVIGAVSAQSYSPVAYDQEQVKLLETVTSQAAIMLANVRLYEKARELSLTDSMTGLANARRFYQELEEVLLLAQRTGHKVSLLVIDSDSLKQINDRYGHPVGDLHLVTLAGIIRSQIRTHDLAARYAGDEFLVVLPDCSRGDAYRTAERIRQAVIDHYRRVEPDQFGVTVSIGVAMYPDDASTSEQLFRVADQAMYQAKQGGRNRVSAAGG